MPLARTDYDSRLRHRLCEWNTDHNLSAMARETGIKQPRLNKYVHGNGRLGIDDVIAIAGFFNQSLPDFLFALGAPLPRQAGAAWLAQTDKEAEWLAVWRRTPPEDQPKMFRLAEVFARKTRHRATPELQRQQTRTTQATKRIGRGRR